MAELEDTVLPSHVDIRTAINDPSRFVARAWSEEHGSESLGDWCARAVEELLRRWLAGRVVVELPEPDLPCNPRWLGDAGTVEVEEGIDPFESVVWLAEQPMTREAARELAAALLAAARKCDAAGSVSGEVPDA